MDNDESFTQRASSTGRIGKWAKILLPQSRCLAAYSGDFVVICSTQDFQAASLAETLFGQPSLGAHKLANQTGPLLTVQASLKLRSPYTSG
jgi:hypothetical protein